MASAFRGTNVWGASEQIKQRYSCWDFGFMGAQNSVQESVFSVQLGVV